MLFKGPWEIIPIEKTNMLTERNMLWCNHGAENQIPDDIANVLREMN